LIIRLNVVQPITGKILKISASYYTDKDKYDNNKELQYSLINFKWKMDYDRVVQGNDTLMIAHNPQIGWQNITSFDIYNWNVGWEFHSNESYNLAPGPGYSGVISSNLNYNKNIQMLLLK